MRIVSVSTISPVFHDQQKSIEADRHKATFAPHPSGIAVTRKPKEGVVLRIVIPWANIAWFQEAEDAVRRAV